MTVAQAQAQAQALECTSDPFIELSCMFGANRANDRFWEQTVANLARSVGVAAPVISTSIVCVDRRRPWHHIRSLGFSPAVSMAVGTLKAPARRLRRRRATG